MSHADPIEVIASELVRRNWQMATAESCTGGGIAAALTARPGSSQWFAGALVTYAIPWKIRLLGVKPEIIDEFGVVSAETVTAMLQGTLDNYQVQAAIAVSGIAGPTGAEPGKPVGTVFVGAATSHHCQVLEMHYQGDRDAVRQQAVQTGLELLARLLEQL